MTAEPSFEERVKRLKQSVRDIEASQDRKLLITLEQSIKSLGRPGHKVIRKGRKQGDQW